MSQRPILDEGCKGFCFFNSLCNPGDVMYSTNRIEQVLYLGQTRIIAQLWYNTATLFYEHKK